MKYTKPQQVQKIFDYLITTPDKVLLSEFRVFHAWFNDSPTYHSRQEVIAKKLNMTKQQVSRSFRRLIEIGVLQKIDTLKIDKHLIYHYGLGKKLLDLLAKEQKDLCSLFTVTPHGN